MLEGHAHSDLLRRLRKFRSLIAFSNLRLLCRLVCRLLALDPVWRLVRTSLHLTPLNYCLQFLHLTFEFADFGQQVYDDGAAEDGHFQVGADASELAHAVDVGM